MAMAMVTLLGRVQKDPKINPGQNGKKSSAFFNITVVDKNGEEKVFTNYNVKVFGPQVESVVQPYIHEGTCVLVMGRQQINIREYQGKTYPGIDVFAEKLQLAGDKSESGAPPAPKSAPAATSGYADDDVPF